MQRLRGLKQLGVSEMTYIPTTHSRFEHSLGVAALAENILREIKKKQPRLQITEKDIICVKIAGLLHDIGHGPYSHIYDGQFRKELKKAEAQGQWLGQNFNDKTYQGLPQVMEGWEHEDGSLMMIDGLLEYLGMEIDERNLDAPLRQTGDGIRAECFGICNVSNENDSGDYADGSSLLPLQRVLTSRDLIFIKECIVGGPLPPKGQSLDAAKKSKEPQQLVGRPDIFKEFLYDVVSNRHSGLDVDKIDYLARDDRRAFGSSGQIDPMFIENAHVAWGKCGRPNKCFRCRHSHKGPVKMSTNEFENKHMMIVYPEKMVQNAMNFFKLRFQNHQKLYTHHTTNAASYMICDILLLADPYIRLSTANEGEDVSQKSACNGMELKLPISRANVHPQSYLLLRDSILDIIATTEDPNLRQAKNLINRYRSHNLYKKVAEEQLNSSHGKNAAMWQRELWSMKESKIASEIVKNGQFKDPLVKFSEEDIIVEKRQIHHGMGSENPVSAMRFLPKSQLSKLRNTPENLPIAEEIKECEYECAIPRAFLQRTLRIYCRRADKNICDFLTTCYHQFLFNIQKRHGQEVYHIDANIPDADVPQPNVLSQSPIRCSNESFAVSQSSIHETTDYEPVRKRRRRPLFSNLDRLDSP
jgi:HD superfamily phosphohydrolase